MKQTLLNISLSRLPGAVSTALSAGDSPWGVSWFRGSVLGFRHTMQQHLYDDDDEDVDDIDGGKNLCQLLGNPHPHCPSTPALLSRQHCSESGDNLKIFVRILLPSNCLFHPASPKVKLGCLEKKVHDIRFCCCYNDCSMYLKKCRLKNWTKLLFSYCWWSKLLQYCQKIGLVIVFESSRGNWHM